LLVEHADDLVQRRDRREECVVELRELLDRVEEVREVEREGEERAGGHVAVVDEPAAVAEDDRGGRRPEQVDDGEVDPAEDGRLVVRGAVAVVDPAERFLLHRLARERLDDAHPCDVLRERGGDEAEPLAHVAIGAVRAAAEPGRHERHRHEHGQGRECQLDVEEKQDHRRPEQEQRVLDQARNAVRHELVERLDVVRDPADDHARAVALVEAERQPLEVGEERIAQVGEDALARPAGQIRVDGGEDEGEEREDEEHGDDLRQPVEVAGADPLVDRELRQVGRRERDERVDQERPERERGSAAVRKRQPDEQTEATPRPPPRPVAYRCAALFREMAPRLPDLHALSFKSPWIRPCSWIS
jgi:hypothetical protein